MKGEPALIKLFDDLVGGLAGVERRQMSGYPAVFINGNMIAGLYGDGMVMRLAEDDLRKITEREGARPFIAMGRTMRGWIVVPPALHTRPTELRRWLDKALAHAAALPAKPSRRKRSVSKAGTAGRVTPRRAPG